MNNTKTLTAIAAILIAATLVVGGTLASSTTTAFAYQQKRGGSQENSKDGNTVTIQKCKQDGAVSGFDNTAEQDCQNVICTHPGDNATCSQEGAAAQPPTPTPTTTTLRVIKKVVCQPTDPDCSLPTLCQLSVVSAPAFSTAQPFSCQSAIGNGVLLTLQPGGFFVNSLEGPGFDTTFDGGCSGTIAAGQHLTCTITNTEHTCVRLC